MHVAGNIFIFVTTALSVHAWESLGFNTFNDVVVGEIIPLITDGGPTFVDQLCSNISELHNKMRTDSMKKTNQEFLNIAEKYGFQEPYHGNYLVNKMECSAAILRPNHQKAREWLNNFAGTHVGSWFTHDGDANKDIVEWYPQGNRGFQQIHWKSRCERNQCDCSVTDSKTGNDCSWGWNFAAWSMPYVYQWNPENDYKMRESNKNGVFTAFPMAFNGYFGVLDKHKCLIWISLSDYCIQCFNGEAKLNRITVACAERGFGQYEVRNSEEPSTTLSPTIQKWLKERRSKQNS